MDDPETSAGAADPARWLLLVHQLPAKPAYLRVKVWRRLQALGAVTVKNSVYVLPTGEQAREDLEWLLKEVAAAGGEGMICEARLIGGLSDQEVRAMFNAARETDYDTLAVDARALADALAEGAGRTVRAEAAGKLSRLKANARQVAAIDFFGANGRETVDGLLARLEELLREDEMPRLHQEGTEAVGSRLGTLRDRVWVTRAGVHVDRIASVWLIHKFIDPEARFKFVPAKGYAPESGELRFDMFEAEFTHEGDRCTFEVLLARTGLADPALAAIGEIVHDIDLKDAKFGREETSGIRTLVAGLCAATDKDEERLARGGAILDDLYSYFASARRG